MGAWAWLLYLVALVIIAVVLQRLFSGRGGSGADAEKQAEPACKSCSAEPGRCLQECAMEAQLRCVSLPDQLKDEAYMLAEG